MGPATSDIAGHNYEDRGRLSCDLITKISVHRTSLGLVRHKNERGWSERQGRERKDRQKNQSSRQSRRCNKETVKLTAGLFPPDWAIADRWNDFQSDEPESYASRDCGPPAQRSSAAAQPLRDM